MNPSQEAVLELPSFVKFDDKGGEAKVAKLTLPTCCEEAFKVVLDEVAKIGDEPFAIVLSGLADSRDKICLERFALNVQQYRMPDNNGHTCDEEHIIVSGPDALRTKVPLKELSVVLDNAGFACDISNHAGSYVCNETYYRCMHRWQNDPRCRGILFVHVPPYENYKHTNPDHKETRSAREVYTAALQKIAQFISRPL